MLGLPTLSLFDLAGIYISASFIRPELRPDFTPCTAVVPRQSLYDINLRVGFNGPNAAAHLSSATASARINVRDPDAAPTELLNRILWYDAMGFQRRYPTVKQSLFFPPAVTIADDDRGEREVRKRKN